MSFTVRDYQDLVGLLYMHPELRVELRQLVLDEDFLAIPQIMREVAENIEKLSNEQTRAEQRLGRLEVGIAELTKAQRRTDQHLAELAEAQKRTDQHVEELAGAQKRTDQHLEELAEAQKRTQSELARLSNRVGSTAEEEAEGVLGVVLEAKGYQLADVPFNLRLNGEVDVVMPLRDPLGRAVWAVVEAKVRLSGAAVEAWAHRMRSAGFRADLRSAGIEGPFLVYMYAMRADLSARQVAEKFGIGLLKSDGEVVAPRGLVE